MIKATAMILMLSLLGLAGCSAPAGEASGRSHDPLGPLGPNEPPQVQVLGQARLLVGLSSPTVTRMDGPIQVSMPVRSMSEQSAELEYRYEFFDQAGQPMQPAMDWTPLTLPPFGQSQVQGQAPDQGAANWRLLIRQAP